MAKPLTYILKKDDFIQLPNGIFRRLKKLLTDMSVLATLDFQNKK